MANKCSEAECNSFCPLEAMPNEAQPSPLGFLAAIISPRESLSALFSTGERALSTVEIGGRRWDDTTWTAHSEPYNRGAIHAKPMATFQNRKVSRTIDKGVLLGRFMRSDLSQPR